MAAPTSTKMHPLVVIFYALWVLVSLAIAGFGAWVASSLAVYHDGPLWLVLVGAFTCFFIVPLIWELVADRDQRGGRIRDAILRSSFISLVFLVVVLLTHATTTFKALATRGDWWLAGSTTPTADAIRGGLHDLADGFEWLFELAQKEGYAPDPEAEDILPPPSGTSSASATTSTVAPPTQSPAARPTSPDGMPLPPGRPIVGTNLTWPLPATIHPLVAGIPEEHTQSITAVGQYLRANIEDPFERVRAIHDFAATWLAYDGALLRDLEAGKNAPSPTVEQAFAQGKGVCAHYAKLIIALAKVTGDRIIYVTGDTRSAADYDQAADTDNVPIDPSGHAWNAAEINGRWYLLDATWNAGHVENYNFVRDYETTYLFTPPEVMTLSHFPKEERWQLLETPLSRSDWLRQPLVRPRFSALGLLVRAPTQPIVSVDDTFTLELENPAGFDVALGIEVDGKLGPLCSKLKGTSGKLSCRLDTSGRQQAIIFARSEPSEPNQYQSIGYVIVDASP